MKYLRYTARGFAMGIAETVPGVSSSTIALILGIYETFLDLLYGLSQVVKIIIGWMIGKYSRKDIWMAIQDIRWSIGVSLFVGMVLAFLSLAPVLETALHDYPQYVYATFFGFIAVSIFIPWGFIRQMKKTYYALASIVAIMSFFAFSLSPASVEDPQMWYVFIGGVVSISALIMPGISGAFILLTLGLYEFILSLVREILDFNLEVLLPVAVFGSGVALGFLGFVRIIKYILRWYHDILMAVLTGILAGSLRIMWPFFRGGLEDQRYVSVAEFALLEIVIVICCMLFGGVLVWGLQRYGQKSGEEDV